MPAMEIRQGDAPSVVYGLKTAHRRAFLVGSTIIGLSNKFSGFQKDKLVIFQNGRIKYRLKETDRLNWALRFFLPVVNFLLCLLFCAFFPQHEPLMVILFIASLVVIHNLFRPRYAVFEEATEIGVSGGNGEISTRSFSIKKDIYRLYYHSGERYSLFKNGTQIAVYEQKLENWRNQYLVYYAAEEPREMIELFGLWIDMEHYNDSHGRTLLKSYPLLPDKHPEYALWRPEDMGQ